MIYDNLPRRIAECCATHPNRIAYRFLEKGEVEQRSFTFAELDRAGRSLASALLDRLPEGPALLVFEPGAEFAVTLVACLYAGILAIPAPVPRRGASMERLEGILKASGASAILTTSGVSQSLAHAVTDASPIRSAAIVEVDGLVGHDGGRYPGFDLRPEAPIFVQYTSGSTLAPRGVVLGSSCTLANIDYTCRGVGFGRDGPEVYVNWMPHFHDMGLLGNIVLSLVKGFESIHLPPLAFVQDPARWLRAISRYGGTATGGPPFAYDLCTRRVSEEEIASLDLSSWRIAFCGAEPVFRSTLDAFAERFRPAGFNRESLVPVYGLAEVGVFAAGSPPEKHEVAAAQLLDRAPCRLDGEANEGIRIVSAGAARLADGEEGEIWFSHPSVALGYLNDEDATAATFGHSLIPDDGKAYLRTGDLGIISGDLLSITGRLKDVLIRNGENIAAADVERLASAVDERLDQNGASAFQMNDFGRETVVIVEKVRGAVIDAAEEADLIVRMRSRVFETLGVQLDHLVIAESGELPRTTSGKVQRSKARELWAGKSRSPSSAPSREAQAV